jgi:hypothetical protein
MGLLNSWDSKAYNCSPRYEVDHIDSNLQRRYRSGVGMLFYLTKYSQPDLCNLVRELSKCMDKALMGTYLELLRVIKFVIVTNISVSELNKKGNSKIGVSDNLQ